MKKKGEIALKELIYLDTEYVHSFIAQTEGGLPTNIDSEKSEEIREQSDSESSRGADSFIEGKFKLGEFEIPLLFKTPTGEISTGIKPNFKSTEKVSLSQLESGKEIISKILHDNALEKVESGLIEKNVLLRNVHEAEAGKYIKIKTPFKIIDFDYLKKAFAPDKLPDLIFSDLDKTFESLKSETKRLEGKQKQLAKAQVKSEEQRIRKEKKEQVDSLKFLESALNYITDIIPTVSYLVGDNILVPLKKDYLREESKDLTFKYGTSSGLKINILGKVTRIIDDVEIPDFDQDFDYMKIGEIVNFILNSIGVLDEGDYIISPIAIYFE